MDNGEKERARIVVFLKRGKECRRVYWIRRTPKNWFIGSFFDFSVWGREIHFTYPEDGNLHYTLKRGNGSKTRVFYNRIEEKGNKRKKRTPKNTPVWAWLLPYWKPPGIKEYKKHISFYFPTVALSTNNMSIGDSTFQLLEKECPKEQDQNVIIPVDDLAKGAINITSCLYSDKLKYSSRSGLIGDVLEYFVDDCMAPTLEVCVSFIEDSNSI
jgi:hypothetical protein